MSSLPLSFKSLRTSEQGMISIMTVMVLMIVISLIVIGFATISRRTQRESLDRQQSTQAFYAAETAVNDVRELLQAAFASGTTIPDKDTCTGAGPGNFYGSPAISPDIDAAKDIKYSCLLVDPAPKELSYSDVSQTSTIIPMSSASGENFNTVTLKWKSKVTRTPPATVLTGCPTSTNNVFSPNASWGCGYGVLRFDLVPTAGALTADGLRNTTMTTFAVPFSSGGTNTVPYAASTANTNNRLGILCTTTDCTLTITGLSQNAYYMRISSLYQGVSLNVTANGPSGALELSGAQALVDATGRSQDVLRRIQVRVPLRATSKNELSDYAIMSTDSICKRFAALNGYFDNDTALSGISTNSSNRLCTSSP
ncbi:MAG TPA: pilus assembly PilX N-terminal domain-containing protein [Candidatus Saccharimonadales bacterium]|nr:pilus assembly PilX N-terminal domain-containing protein [Candidatus Saccharimonadales bacterium]